MNPARLTDQRAQRPDLEQSPGRRETTMKQATFLALLAARQTGNVTERFRSTDKCDEDSHQGRGQDHHGYPGRPTRRPGISSLSYR